MSEVTFMLRVDVDDADKRSALCGAMNFAICASGMRVRNGKYEVTIRRVAEDATVTLALTPKQLERLAQHAVGHCLASDEDTTERALWRKVHEAARAAEKELASKRRAIIDCVACEREGRPGSKMLDDALHTCGIARTSSKVPDEKGGA